MIRHPFSPQADKALRALSAENRKRAAKAFQRSQENPRHPSLNLERLRGHQNLYSIRISISHRAILRRVEGADNSYELVDIDPHDIYRGL